VSYGRFSVCFVFWISAFSNCTYAKKYTLQ
jgi:hypothetical protein